MAFLCLFHKLAMFISEVPCIVMGMSSLQLPRFESLTTPLPLVVTMAEFLIWKTGMAAVPVLGFLWGLNKLIDNIQNRALAYR